MCGEAVGNIFGSAASWYTLSVCAWFNGQISHRCIKALISVLVLINLKTCFWICHKCIGVCYTNHSLWATAITHIFNMGIPEHLDIGAQKLCSSISEQVQNNTNLSQPLLTQLLGRKWRKKESDDKENVSQPVAPTPVAPQSFSGNFTNCTINISLLDTSYSILTVYTCLACY